jgi:hypothetical protein
MRAYDYLWDRRDPGFEHDCGWLLQRAARLVAPQLYRGTNDSE